jgi:hypothetical protein
MKRVTKLVFGVSLPLLLLSGLASIVDSPQEIVPGQKRMAERGIYITSYTAQNPAVMRRLKAQAKKSGINTFVIEAKSFLKPPYVELARRRKLDNNTRVLQNSRLAEFCADLHEEGFIVSARLVVFKDDHLILARPDLAIRVKGGNIYRDHMYGRWCDPYSDEVRLYNELIAESAALSGVDEVQFDYIRFPAEGNAHTAYYPFHKEGVSRVEIINQFLKDVRKRVDKYHVSIAVDIFGVTAWQKWNDIENLGQDIKKMAQHIDVISPMFYPSHFHSGYDDFKNPGSHPYYFVNTGVKKALEILDGAPVKIVPWIQGFDLKSPNFGPQYMREQIQACKDEGVSGFLVWNANNDYSATFSALEKK